MPQIILYILKDIRKVTLTFLHNFQKTVEFKLSSLLLCHHGLGSSAKPFRFNSTSNLNNVTALNEFSRQNISEITEIFIHCMNGYQQIKIS